jgi:very-short-patch-repair endonuclease
MTIAARDLRQHQTKQEEVLWEQLRNKRCCGFKFRRQYVIDRMIVDFYCHECRLVVELYGEVHADKNTQERDTARIDELHKRGYNTLIIYNHQVDADIKNVVDVISRRCRELRLKET